MLNVWISGYSSILLRRQSLDAALLAKGMDEKPCPPSIPPRCQALFKPAIKGHCDGWHRAAIEAAAYRCGQVWGR